MVDVRLPEDADVVVMQRISHEHLTAAVPLIRSKGVAVVIDVDDDLAAIHPGNPAFYAFHPAHPPATHSWRNVVESCRLATHVTVSTEALTRHYAAHGRVSVLRNAVPERYLTVDHPDSDLLGWGGSVRSHPNDLQVIGTAVARLTREGRVFRVVGPPTHVREHLGLDHEPPSTGTLDMHTEWPHELAQLGIGTVPLADTRFNRAKSWLKGMEMAALGVPFVASPRAEYLRLHSLGVGVTAATSGDWYRLLDRLTRNGNLRLEMSERGRDVARRHTIEKTAWRWAEAWLTAARTERERATTAARHTLVTRAPASEVAEGYALGVSQRVRRAS